MHLPSQHIDGRLTGAVCANGNTRAEADCAGSRRIDQEDGRLLVLGPGRLGKQTVRGLIKVQRSTGINLESLEKLIRLDRQTVL